MNTLILIKPWAVQRGLAGEILTRFENRGLRIAALKVLHLTKDQAEGLYSIHKGKPFYESTVEYMSSSPIVAAVLETDMFDEGTIIPMVRKIVGDTDPTKAEMGTIRGDFGLRVDRNVIHATDSEESLERELPIFFNQEEIISYKKSKKR